MSQIITIRNGDLTSQDPNDQLVYRFDWDTDNLLTGVLINSSSFTITQIAGATTTALTKDQESIVAGSRQTQLRIAGGDVGALFEIANKIVTNESPTQTKERSFRLLIEEK
jgi:hypothetical protein